MSKRIFIFRHGQASFGAANYDALSERGRQQAQHLAEHLLAEDIHLDHVLHGSLVRQRDTAQAYIERAQRRGHSPRTQEQPAFNEFQAEKVVKHYLPRLTLEQPELGELLREPAGFRSHFPQIFGAVIKSWQADRYPHPRIETWQAFRERVQAGFRELTGYLAEDQQAGVFTSGGVISVLLQPVMGESDDLMPRLNQKIANASVTLIELHGDDATLSLFNDYQHLESPDLVTFR